MRKSGSMPEPRPPDWPPREMILYAGKRACTEAWIVNLSGDVKLVH
jgi:hypothetical protein